MKIPDYLFFKDKKKRLLIVGAVVAAFYLIYIGIVPRLQPGMRINDIIKLEEASLKKNRALHSVSGSIRQTYAELKPLLDNTGNADEKQIKSALLQEIERIVSAAGASLVSVSPRKAVQSGKNTEIYYADIAVEATIQQLIAVLDLLNKSSRLITMDDFSIAVKEKAETTVRLDASIGLILVR